MQFEPLPSCGNSAANGVDNLMAQEWYWPRAGRNEVGDAMKGMPEGAFLVRDSSTREGEYTLTVRKGGTTKLLRVFHCNGMYGLSYPLEYRSMAELVARYQLHSLAEYNEALDVSLLYPVPDPRRRRSSVSLRGMIVRFKEADTGYRAKSQEYDDMRQEYELCTEKLQVLRIQLASECKVVDLYESQKIEYFEHLKCVGESEKFHYLQNFDRIKFKLAECLECCEDLRTKIHLADMHCNHLDVRINEVKPALIELERETSELRSWLQSNGVSNKELQKYLPQLSDENIVAGDKKDNLYDLYSALHHREFGQQLEDSLYVDANSGLREKIPLLDSSEWLAKDFSRVQSLQSLSGTPPGTFLIRPKDTNGTVAGPSEAVSHTHTLDIKSSSGVLHIRIFHDEGGFGFAEPFNISTITELVLFYSSSPLSRHNTQLPPDLRMIYPLFSKQK